VKTRNLTDLVYFDEGAARTEVLYETERMWTQVICMQGSQGLGPMTDENADGLVAVLSGRVSVQIGKGRARMRQWEVVLVPKGEDLTIRNASDEPSVVLLVLAPPPG
jgi:glyoxylate utilization-related uncharacterized protein